jgi:hypothetical protein
MTNLSGETKNRQVLESLKRVTGEATLADAQKLRRAALTLRRWYEHECNGVIQRDGDDGEGAPYWYSPRTGERISPANDREKGAIKTVARICKALGIEYFLQTDPRGGTLYVDNKPIPDNNYNRATFLA